MVEVKLLCFRWLSPSLSLRTKIFTLSLKLRRRGFQALLQVTPSTVLMLCGCISNSIATLMSRSVYPVFQILESLRVQLADLMVSFDVVCLFTNVTIVDSLELLSHHFEDDALALFKHALTSTYFGFDGQFYEQTDGVAMASPHSPLIAIFFMEDFENKSIEQATCKPVCWFRYILVDDTFIIWPHGQEKLREILNRVNGLHKKIEFTLEKEEKDHLPFLDIDIYKKKRTFPEGTSKFGTPSKKNNLYLHQYSHYHPANEKAVHASLIHRAKTL